MPDCNHDCSSCNKSCEERTIEKLKPHQNTNIKKIIAVVSGKGGVGKSLTTSLLAVNARRENKEVALMDADITGPSIPTIFGIDEMATGNENSIFPVLSKTGIKTISLNELTEDKADPVIWRGPVIANLIQQFFSDVDYGEVDELYIDMPPGTGDVPLTVFQSIPVDGIVIVTSPQDLVYLIVEKAIRMAKMMNVPVIGLVSNLSYCECPHCGEKIYPFGKSNIEELCAKYDIKNVDYLPIDPNLASLCDKGQIEAYQGRYLSNISKAIDKLKKD